jgi:DNA-binding NarL/FixJ family response regulator
MKKTTVFVVDDHRLVREMLVQLCNLNETTEVIGESGEVEEAVQMIRVLRPDVVLLDINLFPVSGLDAVPLIRRYSPLTRIIGMSMYTQPAYAKKMMQLGAKGYVTKNSPRHEMVSAIEEVMQNRKYICWEIKNSIARQMFTEPTSSANPGSLSLREIEIIKLIKEGHSSKEIAAALWISVKTVEVHRYNILKKLNLKNSASLINFFYNNHSVNLLAG